LAGQKLAFIGQKVPISRTPRPRGCELCSGASLVAALPIADASHFPAGLFPNCEIDADFTI
jgi:hypothetical protein